MAEQVFDYWLDSRDPGAATDVNSIRPSAQRFANKRLHDEGDVRRVVLMALDHFAPDRSVMGRPALAIDEPMTPQRVAALWLAGNTDVRTENIPRIVR